MTRSEIISEIDLSLSFSVLFGDSLFIVNLPKELRNRLHNLMYSTIPHKVLIGRTNNPHDYFELNYDDCVKKILETKENNLRVLNHNAIISIGHIFELLKANDLLKHTKEYEFLKHLRNAISHGNRFHFLKGEPKKEAKFENFEIKNEMHGLGPVIGGYIWAGDVYRLFEFIKNNL